MDRKIKIISGSIAVIALLMAGYFNFEIENIKYENAGHLISGNPNNPSSARKGKMMIDGNSYEFNFGGTEAGDRAAQQDASQRVFHFLSKLKNE